MFAKADLDDDGFVTADDFYNIMTHRVYWDSWIDINELDLIYIFIILAPWGCEMKSKSLLSRNSIDMVYV